MTQVLVGLGSNLGDRLDNLARALEAIEELPDTTLRAVSHAVESEPWGVELQPAFANAVALLSTQLSADRLLAGLKEAEVRLGRQAGVRYGPRVIDLDILLFGGEVWDTEALAVPHPRLAERQFALLPLLEVAPHATWPDGTPFAPETATEGRILGRLGAVPGYERLTVTGSEG